MKKPPNRLGQIRLESLDFVMDSKNRMLTSQRSPQAHDCRRNASIVR